MTAPKTAPKIHSRTYTRRAALVAVLIALAGPLIGGLYFIAAFGVSELIGARAMSFGGGSELAFYLGRIIVASYSIGLVPAGLSSIWIGWLTYRHGTFSYAQAFAGALLMTIIVPAIMFGMSLALSGGQIKRFATYLVVGAVLALIAVATAVTLRGLLGLIGILPAKDRE